MKNVITPSATVTRHRLLLLSLNEEMIGKTGRSFPTNTVYDLGRKHAVDMKAIYMERTIW